MDAILQQLASHFTLMETMTTRDYLAFRDKLAGASGFQSAQMRELEILMGLPEAERIPLGPTGSYLTALKEHDAASLRLCGGCALASTIGRRCAT